jgi:hypothetical protein
MGRHKNNKLSSPKDTAFFHLSQRLNDQDHSQNNFSMININDIKVYSNLTRVEINCSFKDGNSEEFYWIYFFGNDSQSAKITISKQFWLPAKQNAQNKTLKNFNYDSLEISIIERQISSNGFFEKNYSIIVSDNQKIISDEKLPFFNPEYIIDSWLTDLDHDNNFEITIYTDSGGSSGCRSINILEWNKNKFVKANYSKNNLNDSLLSAIPSLGFEYRGRDTYLLNGDKIYHEYPLYRKNDANCCPSGEKVRISYKFINNEITKYHSEILKTTN